MPNWCYNKVTIRAKKEVRDEIQKFLKGMHFYRPFSPKADEIMPLESCETIFSFHSVIPQPDDLLDEEDPRRKSNVPRMKDNDRGMPGWYNWRVENWGTKWDVTQVGFYETKVSMTYEFETAWSPVIPVIQALSEKFPNAYITLTYKEEGMGFGGSISFKDGMIERETEYA